MTFASLVLLIVCGINIIKRFLKEKFKTKRCERGANMSTEVLSSAS